MSAKSFHKDLQRTLMKTKMRFLSILAITALGVGFFAGIKATEPDMVLSADAYYQKQSLSDFRVLSPLGFRPQDLESVTSLPGIGQVQPGYIKDFFLYSESGNRYTVRLYSYDPQLNEKPDAINQLIVKQGRLPEKPGEILLEAGRNVPEDIDIADAVTLGIVEKEIITDYLARDTFTVVGRVHSPLYISFDRGQTSIGNGSIDFYAYICISDFVMERFAEVYLRTISSPDLTAYTDEYAEHIAYIELALIEQGQISIADETEGFRDELKQGKSEWLANKERVERELEKAEKALDQAEQDILDGEKALDEQEIMYTAELAEQSALLQTARNELNQGLISYYDGYALWLEGYNEYQDGRDQLNQSKHELDAAENQLNQVESELELARSQLDQAEDQLAILEQSIQALKEIRESLPKDQESLSDEQFASLIDSIRPYSEELAEYMQQNLSPDSPELLSQIRFFLDSTLITLQQTYNDSMTEYQDGYSQYLSGQAELTRQRRVYDDGYQEYEKGVTELDAVKAVIDQGKNELDQVKAELDQAQSEIDAGEVALRTGQLKLEREINDGRLKLDEARSDLEEGRALFAAEKEEALQKIREAENQIRESERKLLELPEEWFVMTRDHQPGYSEYGDDARRIGAVATIFPLFFLLVAALVCLTTMTRMIEEERVQIGTLKALGYNTLSISSKYLVYALSASLTGSIIGLLIGFQLFPASIMNAYAIMYFIPDRRTPFHPDVAAVSVMIAALATVLVALLATLRELKSTPAVLMQPRAPRPGKRILLEYIKPLWSHLSFMQKLTARNLFRYKQRFFMTIIGIAGCTALLLTGFGLKDSVNAIIGQQFDEIFIYDGQLMIDPEKDLQGQAIDSLLGGHESITSYMPLMSETVTALGHVSNPSYSATIIIPHDLELLPEFYRLRDRQSGDALFLPPNGAVITEKLAELLDIRKGDSITFRDAENRTYSVMVSSIAENYLTHYIYISPEYFDQITYRQPVFNAAVFHLSDADQFDAQKFQEYLLDDDAVLGSMLTLNLSDDFATSIESLNYIVIILIIAAGALAFVVLYNLTSINISERIREIATIKVLGFRDREVSDYVFRENILLTLFGIVSGIILGVYLHRFVMGTMETDAMMFGRQIHWLSYLLSVMLTMTFTVIVNIFMFYHLKKIKLVESLKSVE